MSISARSVPVRSLTTAVSVLAEALSSNDSISARSSTMLPMLRVNSTRPPFAVIALFSLAFEPLNAIRSTPS